MSWLRQIAVRLWAALAGERKDHILDEELRTHLALLIEQNIERGMSPEAAQREAKMTLGGAEQIKESVRDYRGLPLLETLWQDIRFAFRMLSKSPGFTAVAVLTLALGIGANTAIFSLANAAFFRALPYPHPERLAFLWQNNKRTGETEGTVSYPNYADWRAQSNSFEDMAFIRSDEVLLDKGGTLQHVPVAEVSTNFLSVLGVSPFLGRDFTFSDALGPTYGVIIGYDVWQSYYGGDPHIIGRPAGSGISANDTIIGVMPQGFSFPPGTEMWKPREPDEYMRTKTRPYPFFKVIGRLHAGVKWSSAQAEMNAIAKRLAAEYPASDDGVGIHVVPLREQLSQGMRQGLLLLWATIFGVLLIACVNAANLIMARASSRQKEIAVRFSLGATHARIVRQFLAEGFLLAFAGAIAGLFLAIWTVAFVSKFNSDIARLGGSVFDARVLLYTTGVVAFTTLICAIAPAFSVSHLDPSRALKEASTAASPRAQMIRNLLIIAEVSLSFILLAGSGLLIRSLWQVLSVNPGLDAKHVLALNLRVPWTSEWPMDSKLNAVYRGLIGRLSDLPGVVSVGSTSKVLFPDNTFRASFVVEGQPPSSGQKPFLPRAEATPDYFRTVGIPLLRGRFFADADTAENAQPVAIINETMANHYWPHTDPLGKRFKVDDPTLKSAWFTIVGVVGDVRQEGFENSAGLMAYFPSAGDWADDVAIRAAGNPAALIPEVRHEIRTVSANFGIDQLAPVSEILADHESQRRFDAWLLGAFAFIALLLAAVGIYGSLSYWVKQRTQEIGVRMVFGAQADDIFALVIGRGMTVILVALALGIAGALALTHLIASMLFGVRPEDPLTYAAVALLLATVALAACYIPARRAMRVDPMIALRYE
jgi:putative ABC transport system permease protein